MRQIFISILFIVPLFASGAEVPDSTIWNPGRGGSGFKPKKMPSHQVQVCQYDANTHSLFFDLPSSTPASFTIYNCMDEVIYSGVANPEVPYPIEPLHSDNYIIYISQENDTYVCPLFINL